jgi:hypothetical protein
VKKLLLSTAALLGLLTTASAQVNVVPQIGMNTSNLRNNTYTVSIFNLVPASTPTDMFCLSAGTKNVHIRRIALSGTAGTLITTQVSLIKRATLDTGTAAVNPTYIGNIVPLNSTNPTATAVPVAYNSTGGNPTITDTTTHAIVRATNVTFGVSGTTAAPADRLVWEFGTAVDSYSQGADIPAGSTQQYCINLNATSISSGVLSGAIEWTEF